MSRICFFVLFLVFNIAIQFGDCKNTLNNIDYDCDAVPSGSDKTRLLWIETMFENKKKEEESRLKNMYEDGKKSISNFMNDKEKLKSMSSFSKQLNFIVPGNSTIRNWRIYKKIF